MKVMNGWLGLLKYYLKAKRLHGVHSPFIYEFQEKVLLDKTVFSDYLEIEQCVKTCKQNQTSLTFQDFGANPGRVTRTIGQLAKRSGISRKYGRLLYRMTRWFQPGNILELGTSLGFASAYMIAGAGAEARLTSMEGAAEIADQAIKNLEGLNVIHRCTIVQGPIDSHLEVVMERNPPFDFVYMDANHKLPPTLRYFEKILTNITENAIIIMDDIHWSHEMHEAWKLLSANPKIAVSVELDRMGILFCRTGIAKEHFYLSF